MNEAESLCACLRLCIFGDISNGECTAVSSWITWKCVCVQKGWYEWQWRHEWFRVASSWWMKRQCFSLPHKNAQDVSEMFMNWTVYESVFMNWTVMNHTWLPVFALCGCVCSMSAPVGGCAWLHSVPESCWRSWLILPSLPVGSRATTHNWAILV